MIAKVESFFTSLRRLFSRSDWAARLLRLSKPSAYSEDLGLIMIQIDGLSSSQFQRAMERGNLPFLKKLLQKEHYVKHLHYSGVPSNTPTVQAEIFYGKKTAVPAFSFRDHETGKIMKMYENASAETVEARLRAESPGLLEGGSAYCNIFSGGAAEPHFCASKTGWRGMLHAVNPLLIPFWVIFYADILLRTTFLMIIEFGLAILDCIRGTLKGKIFWKEFEFIAARVMVCVLLRELIVIGSSMDISRGLPVIHLNFIGYDDQSHRRGPSSAFAHWSLRGIDDSIRRIWDAAGRCRYRDYDIWIYSDHGQEKTMPYPLKYGRSLEEAVQDVFGEKITRKGDGILKNTRSECCGWDSKISAKRRSARPAEKMEENAPPSIIVAAMGPVGHIYLPKKLTEAERDFFGNRLAVDAGIPLVLAPASEGKAYAWTARGKFNFPEQADEILGKEHPFLSEAPEDILRVCHHPDAGDFIVMGWTAGVDPLSFPLENGAHAGITPEETSGFAFLPQDAPLRLTKKYIRPLDLREAAQRLLGKALISSDTAPKAELASKKIRIMTYNVHGCMGMDSRLSVDRISRLIARHDSDIIALQEIDVGRLRSGGVDQAEKIARKLEMHFHFHSIFRLKDEHYGNAIFSRYPMGIMKMEALPALSFRKDPEPRGALWVTVDIGGARIQLINTHLSIWPEERALQARTLAGQDWLGHADCSGPVILCGDLNALPRSAAYLSFSGVLSDSQKILADHRMRSTWSGKYPMSRIDHVFLSPHWRVTKIEVPQNRLSRVASDHLPLIVDLEIEKKELKNNPGVSLEEQT